MYGMIIQNTVSNAKFYAFSAKKLIQKFCF